MILWTAAFQASLAITRSRSLLKLMSIESVMPSNHLILYHPLLLLPLLFLSIRVFSSESALHIRWPKYWSFSLSISPSHEYSGLISFRMGWLDLLEVQGTLKSLFQHHSSKASVLAAISSQTPVSLCCHLLLSISHWVVCSVLASKCPHIPRTMFWEGSTSRTVIDGADPGWKKSHIRTTLTSQVSVSRP